MRYERFRFALNYALRNLNRSRQRTLFAVLSIAAGVATVTALRVLGLMITDALTANAQVFLRSDILVAAASAPLRISLTETDGNRPLFSPTSTQLLDQWARENGVEITYRLSGQLLQGAAL